MENKATPADFSHPAPDIPVIGPYLPIYGKFDLTAYVKGASDYEIMSFLVQCYNNVIDAYEKVADVVKDSYADISELQEADKEINARIDTLVDNNTIIQLVKQAIDKTIKSVFFGLNDDGYFVAYIPNSWDCITFGTIMDCNSPDFGRLTLTY